MHDQTRIAASRGNALVTLSFIGVLLTGCSDTRVQPLAPRGVSGLHRSSQLIAGSGSWATDSPMPTARAAMAAGVVNGVVYVVGGSNGGLLPGTVEAFDAVGNAWSTKSPEPTPAYGQGGASSNGIVYAIGGLGIGFVSNALQAYNPAADSWATLAPMPTARAETGVGVVNGIIYVVGGEIAGPSLVNTVEAYDPATNTWTGKASMPTARGQTSVEVVNGILYVIGGYNSSGVLSNVEAYDPSADTWTKKAPMTTARDGAASGVMNGAVVIAGGNTPTGVVSVVEAYDPASDSWTSLASMPTARFGLIGAVVNGNLYAVGGTNGSPLGTVEALSFAAPRAQTITFGPLGNQTIGNPPFAISASASSGLPATFLASGACSVSGTTVSLTAVGSCTITANQGGNAMFLAAPSVSQSFAITPPPSAVIYLHGSGGRANPATLTLDGIAPTSSAAKYQDSPSVKFSDGNSWKEIGTWTAAPSVVSGSLSTLGNATAWVGLQDRDDAGTRFDVRVEVYVNGSLITAGEVRCLPDVDRNPANATEVVVAFPAFSAVSFNGTSDVLSYRQLTRIGTTSTGAACGGHRHAAGLRSYFDATSEPASLSLTIGGPVVGLSPQVVTGGDDYSCAIRAGGAAFCWGSNAIGQLGNGTNMASSTPVAVAGGQAFVSVSAGTYQACAIAADGSAWCWGSNAEWNLGDGTNRDSNVPVAVAGNLRFASLSVARDGHGACGITTDGIAYCWGNIKLGSTTANSSAVPIAVTTSIRFKSVSTSANHPCAVALDGTAYCWGDNSFGQIGDGSPVSPLIYPPTAVAGGLHFSSVTVSPRGSCGVTTNGLGYCWGEGQYGALGDGATANALSPVPVSGGLQFVSVSLGGGATNNSGLACGINAAGSAYCWGDDNGGDLGNGATTLSSIPVPVSGGLTFTAIGSAYIHACGVTSASAVYCWGHGDHGELGNGSTGITVSVPVLVAFP